jgi:hypothetical protein
MSQELGAASVGNYTEEMEAALVPSGRAGQLEDD